MQHKAGQSARIAVINDDTSFLDLMRDLLETEGGYEAVICREWGDALAFVKAQQPVPVDIETGSTPRAPGVWRPFVAPYDYLASLFLDRPIAAQLPRATPDIVRKRLVASGEPLQRRRPDRYLLSSIA